MRKFKLLISILLIVVSFAFALSYYLLPGIFVNDSKDQFSALRVSEDIKTISKEPHSIENPEAREKVRDFLTMRLKEMQIPSSSYSYDSVLSRFRTPILVSNIYASIDPPGGKASGYLLLVAHLDSRFKSKVLGKEVYSHGAADDGYGLGVILESVRLALRYRDDWKQGVKILFTDTEESDLEGMKCALSDNPEIFDNVGLVINVEARGVKGPVLLFETSAGNKCLIDLYKSANYPISYSLTSAVYKFLPSTTDYSLLKESFPGMNFSVIGDLKYYHTDLDNFNNISLGSIQHYGVQITPIINRYLTSSAYSNSKSLVSNHKVVFFTIPLIGLATFTSTGYLAFNILTFLIFIWLFLFLSKRGVIGGKGVIASITLTSLFVLGSVLVGFSIAWLSAFITGQKYNIINLPYVSHDWIILVIISLISLVLYMIYYIRGIRRMSFNPVESVVGNVCIQIILSIVLYLWVGENFFLLIPAFLSVFSIFASIAIKSGSPCIVAIILILLILVPFYHILVLSLTFGALPLIMLIYTILVSLMIPLSECFLRKLF